MLLCSRGVPVGDRLCAHGALTVRPRRARSGHRAAAVQSALTASFIFIFKTARRYLRKRHSSSDSGGVTHTFAIRFITSSIDIRMGGKNKKLKAGKNRGKGTRVSSPTVTDSRSPSPLCEQGQAVEEPPMSLRGRSQTNSPSSCRPSFRIAQPLHPATEEGQNLHRPNGREDDMASWLEANEMIYNKKVSA